jgi:hypothetical protein
MTLKTSVAILDLMGKPNFSLRRRAAGVNLKNTHAPDKKVPSGAWVRSLTAAIRASSAAQACAVPLAWLVVRVERASADPWSVSPVELAGIQVQGVPVLPDARAQAALDAPAVVPFGSAAAQALPEPSEPVGHRVAAGLVEAC